jgi:calcium-dependent protein kinase
LGSEVDSKLGVTGSVLSLRTRCDQCGQEAQRGLTLTTFGEVLWDLLWCVQKEFGQALVPGGTPTQQHQGSPCAEYDFVPDKAGDLGSGTYGAVRLARERASGDLRAVKIVQRTDLFFGSEQLDTELEYLRLCDHPHIVKLYEYYVDHANIYLVMDYCSGGELQEVINKAAGTRKPIPEYFTSAVIRQVILAIAHVHARGIVHMDLKSANVMLMPSTSTLPPGRDAGNSAGREEELFDKQPHAMVIDLGVSQLFRPGNFRHNRPMGTPSTMAPEVWLGEVTPKADVFSCGVVLFELLSLLLPFACGADVNQSIMYWNTAPSPPWGKLGCAPQVAVDLCRAMLQRNRHQRPTAAQCLRTPFVRSSLVGAGKSEPATELLAGLASMPNRSVLHKSVALSIARAWPSNRLPTIKRLFEELDVHGTGRLNKGQICSALQRLGMDRQSSMEAADAMDLSRDGTVDWTEFVAACVQLSSDAFDADLERIFKQADSDGDGLLSQEDISKLLGAEHLRGDAVRDVFADLIGRTEQGARVDWLTFQQHFRRLPAGNGGEGGAASSRGGHLTVGALTAALGLGRSTVGLPADLWTQAANWLDQTREAFWPRQDDPGEPPEDVLEHLAEMGFTNRERCVAVLKLHRNNLSSPGLFEELLRTATSTPGAGAGAGA